MKTCTKCKEEYPATTEYFRKYKKSLDGLSPICGECHSADRLARMMGIKEDFIKGVVSPIDVINQHKYKFNRDRGFVYIAHIPIISSNVYKIGCSRDVPTRVNALEQHYKCEVALVRIFYAENKYHMERKLHNIFNKSRFLWKKERELFRLTKDDINYLCLLKTIAYEDIR